MVDSSVENAEEMEVRERPSRRRVLWSIGAVGIAAVHLAVFRRVLFPHQDEEQVVNLSGPFETIRTSTRRRERRARETSHDQDALVSDVQVKLVSRESQGRVEFVFRFTGEPDPKSKLLMDARLMSEGGQLLEEFHTMCSDARVPFGDATDRYAVPALSTNSESFVCRSSTAEKTERVAIRFQEVR